MKKRTEIQQDLKRGFGSIPIGIKILVKWLLVGFVAYGGAFRVCLRWWYGDEFRRYSAHVGGFGGSGFPHPFKYGASFPLSLPFFILLFFIILFCVIL